MNIQLLPWLISVLLHGLLLAAIIWATFQNTIQEATQPELSVTIYPAKVTEVPLENTSSAAVKKEPKATPVLPQSLHQPGPKPVERAVTATNKEAGPTKKLDFRLRGNDGPVEYTRCTGLERATAAHHCAEPVPEITDPVREHFRQSINRGMIREYNVKDDINRAAFLAEQLALVQQMAKENPQAAALLKDEQEALRSEIQRIDNRLKARNLLHLPGIVKKAVENAKD